MILDFNPTYANKINKYCGYVVFKGLIPIAIGTWLQNKKIPPDSQKSSKGTKHIVGSTDSYQDLATK
ncbi:MAG: hypothetical protein ABI892_20315 [Flavobacterium sp.]